MYCSKCGKEVKDTDDHCPNCGTKIGTSGIGLNLSPDAQNSVHQVLKRLKDAPKSYYACIFLLIISAVLVGNSMFKVSFELFTSYSYEMTMFEREKSWKTVFILGYSAAILGMLYPVLFEKKWKNWHFILGIMMPVASLSWFFVILIKATSGVDLGAYSGFADALNFSAGLTTNGILFLLVSIGTIVMTFKARDEILNAGKLDRTIEPNQNAKAKVVGVAILPPDEVKDGRDVCLTFKLADGREINLFEKSEYQANLGDEGNLTWNGGIVVFFEKT